MKKRFCKVEDAVDAVSRGKVIIVADSEERENEGDFLAAAEAATAQTIHFMITEGRGQLCVPVLPDVASRLELAPMVDTGEDDSLPRFTIPVDHRTCRTGISPSERAFTIRAMLDLASGPADFVRPGHIFPLVARPGGVLQRSGHTESAVDLARLANLTPAGVLCEICSRDGQNMAGREELFEIAARFDLPIITIDDLIEFRRDASCQGYGLLDSVSDITAELRAQRCVQVAPPTRPSTSLQQELAD
jgi:3,4-dihydroxy 2-butanone 4-phosphate synthase/GTP cyclohydrolase II